MTLGSATGFVVERNGQRLLITNWHVVTGKHPQTGLSPTGVEPDELLVLHNRSAQLGSWIPKVERLPSEERRAATFDSCA